MFKISCFEIEYSTKMFSFKGIRNDPPKNISFLSFNTSLVIVFYEIFYPKIIKLLKLN